MFKKTLPLIVLVSLFVAACDGGGGGDSASAASGTPSCTLGTSTLGGCKL
jgi:hypothetical protein